MTFFVTWLESLYKLRMLPFGAYSKNPRLAQTQYTGFVNHFKCHSGLLRAFHSVYGLRTNTCCPREMRNFCHNTVGKSSICSNSVAGLDDFHPQIFLISLFSIFP
uniref:Uncharacterized protein n=1 Tax=Brassica campestris TaxID=3711 RepID=A0A3P6AZT3_BRACM|nr:unnamed protein product [Brassica rapa]